MGTKSIILTASIFGAFAVIMGAMGAHALKALLTENSLDSFLTGARYNMFHAITLLAISGNKNYIQEKWMNLAVKLIIIGTILFSGSIYLLSTKEISDLDQLSILGPITPVGGVLLILGWLSIGVGVIKKKN
jgi:uncharacterized membrane protein YgdD (TMEM256/DUF423 family)